MRRVGHKGADHIAPGNTLASFDAALAAGVDMVEFDIVPAPGDPGRLILAHDHRHDVGSAPTLEEGLAHFASEAFDGIELDVDLKRPGYEAEVVSALARYGLGSRSLISTQYPRSLDVVQRLDPSIRRGWSVPRLSNDPTANPLTAVVALPLLGLYRAVLPWRMLHALRSGRVHAVMANHRLVTRRLVRAVHAGGGELFAWTVDDLASIRRLEALGVDGVISNDPRLFARRG